MQGVTSLHAEHHIRVCGLLCRPVDDVALCLSLIRRAYAFRFSGDRRDFIRLSSYPTSPKLLGRVATVYVVPSQNEGVPREQLGSSRPLHFFPSRLQCSGKGDEAGLDPIWLHSIRHLTDFSDFSSFRV